MTMSDGRPVIGLVGAGGISRAHLPALLELGSRVLVLRRTGADSLVAAHPGASVPLEIVDSLAELLDRSDVVDVVTPTPTHLDIVRAALEAGCDVICEKPLARTAADARELADCAAATGSRLFPAHVVRYFPEYLALKRAVDRGEAGRLAVLRFLRSGSFPASGWFADLEASGGVIMDQMIHDLDQARLLAGPVRSISALRTRSSRDGHRLEVGHVNLTHTSGAISQCSGVWGPPSLTFSTEYAVTGDVGTLRHSSLDGGGGGAGLEDDSSDVLDPYGPYTAQLREFFAAMTGGPAPRVSVEDGVEAVRIAEAALESVATGAPVSLVPEA